ncbi:MAG TPA: bifunctional hydroxymethylpyrimidine kinase/phosphomethylpyrimidine kinase [Solirubrobacteraceae bacterium]
MGRTPVALTIAGSDSGGGAGIQADLKAFARCGVHGTSAITAITAQNTLAVEAIHPVPPEIVLAQVRAIAGDIGVDAVKVGMLGTAAATLAVARALDELPAGTPVVVDPVMVAESGARLLDADAQRALVEEILPRATVITPNLPEARFLAGWTGAGSLSQTGSTAGPVRAAHAPGPGAQTAGQAAAAAGQGQAPAADEDEEAEALARALLTLGPRIVVLTGGHRARAVDLFLDSTGDGAIVKIEGERHPDGAAHGSGCTHSSVLAAQLALGRSPLDAARTARALAGAAVANGLRDIGAGAGPVDVLGLRGLRST